MPDTTVRIPAWADPNNASVLDSWWQKAARTLGNVLGAADPTAQAMGIAAPLETGPIRAFHGSPHDFDAFSLSKIGTGEGAQAYGHGLYFAENPAVAHDYRNSLSYLTDQESRQILDMLPKSFQGPDNVRNIVGQIRNAVANGDVAKPSHFAQEYDVGPVLHDAYKKAGEILDNKGKVYEVNIHASPDELLDWDKPLSQQPQKVQEAFQKAAQKNAHLPFFEGVTDADLTHRYYGKENVQDMSGAGVMQVLEKAAGKAGAPQILKDAGIKGIQYLDQGSRAAGEGTRNFVIFDDKIIDIAKKYGVSLPVAAKMYADSQREGGVKDHAAQFTGTKWGQ